MLYKKGDKIAFLNEPLKGVVVDVLVLLKYWLSVKGLKCLFL